MRKVKLMHTRDCEAGYGPGGVSWGLWGHWPPGSLKGCQKKEREVKEIKREGCFEPTLGKLFAQGSHTAHHFFRVSLKKEMMGVSMGQCAL